MYFLPDTDPKLILKSSHLIFPGVGSFGAAMKIIKKKKILDAIKDETGLDIEKLDDEELSK